MKVLGWAQQDAFGPDRHAFVPAQYPWVRSLCMPDGPLWKVWDLEAALKRLPKGDTCPACLAASKEEE